MNLTINSDVIVSKQLSLCSLDIDSVLKNCDIVYDKDGMIYFVDKDSKVIMYSIWFRDTYLKQIIHNFENGES